MRALALFAVLTFGCSPTLMDAAYRCSDGGTCPEGWLCGPDGICYANGVHEGSPCTENSQCRTGTCAFGPDGEVDVGYCSAACPDGECGGRVSFGATCVQEVCLRECDTSNPCPSELFCGVFTLPPPDTGMLPPLCFGLDNTNLLGVSQCMNPAMDCQSPGLCVQSAVMEPGLCTMRCQDDDHCPEGGTCYREEMRPDGYCVRRCNPMGPPPGECGMGLECKEVTGLMGAICAPTAWTEILALPRPGM